MTCGFVYHEDYLEHKTGPGHPECPERVASIVDVVRSSGLLQDLVEHKPSEAARASLEAVHSADHVARMHEVGKSSSARLGGGDTVVAPGSERAALLASGGVLESVQNVMEGTWSRAFVCCRPPGHHAEQSAAMGFCMFNHVAVAAAHLRKEAGLERVAIVDFDVHHGNGTQHLFEQDPSVFYASLHQWPHYPGTGAEGERGIGDGEGTTLNCPMAAGTGDKEWMNALESQVIRQLEEFRPQFLLISAGFDAHRRDPLSGTQLTTGIYRDITSRLRELAERQCEGRVVSLLEGGYNLEALAESVAVHLEAMR